MIQEDRSSLPEILLTDEATELDCGGRIGGEVEVAIEFEGS